MKQTITSLALLSLLVMAPMASAEEVRVNVRLNATTSTEKVREGIKEMRASSTARKLELRLNIVKRQAEHAGVKLLATIERLDRIAARLDSRITKVESSGGVASTSRAFLLEAKDSLAKARLALQVFSSNPLSGTDLALSLKQIRTVAETVKVHLREAHRALVNATLSLKPGRAIKDGMGRATTTASSSSATTTSN